MSALLRFLRGPLFRSLFMAAAVVAAIWAIIKQWEAFSEALSLLAWWQALLAVVASFVYVWMTMRSWRALLDGTGQPVPARAAGTIFFTSQVAKYLPGGVWNFVAAAEAGVEHQVSRRRSIAVLMTSMMISILSGLIFAVAALAFGPSGVRTDYGWAAVFLPVIAFFLVPAVLNGVINLALRLIKREPLEQPLTWRALGWSTLWSLAAWLVAGFQVWLMLSAMGLPPSAGTFLLATGGYALAWTVGFLIFFVPAGIGVREVVLGAVLTGFLTTGAALAVILLSRVFLTLADLGWGVGAGLAARKRHQRLTHH